MENINTEQITPRYFIDLDWYQQSNRSFTALAESRLCLKCKERLKAREKEVSPADLLTTIRDCCSKTPEFVTRELPILESIFRLFLANGNQSLDLEELGKQLTKWRGDTYCTSAAILSHLLGNDQYYGLCRLPG